MGTTSAQPAAMLPAAELRSKMESFLSRCAEPCLIEPGEKAVLVVESRYSMEVRDGGVVFHVWGDDGNIVRRISGIAKETRNRLDLRARRFGRPEMVVSLIDRAKKGTLVERQEIQAEFRERLRRMLAREFADWQLERLSSSPDLERSFSPSCSRGVLRRGKHAWAIIGVGREAGAAAADGALTFGLIWLDYLRQSEPGVVFHGLRLFLPAGQTDFVFCWVGERWGLGGVIVTLALYAILFAKGLHIAASTRDPYGRLLAVGIVALLASQTIINAGMTAGIAPIAGITLPLMSYGGSSLLSTCIALGLLMNVGMRPGYYVAPEPFAFRD